MRRNACNLLASWALMHLLTACAGSGGDGLLRSHDYLGAIAAYESDEQVTPDDGQIKRNLGVAYLRAGELERAVAKLEEARALRPDDARGHFFLAQAREAVEDFAGALIAYDDYLRNGGKNETSLRLRVRELSRRQAEREIEAALRAEAAHEAPSDSTTLAVPDFANISGSQELAPLAKGLAAVVITDLRRVEGFRIVERERWNVLLSELQLAHGAGSAPVAGDSIADEGSSPDSVAADPAVDSVVDAAGSESPESAEFAGESAEISAGEGLLPSFEEDESGLIDPTTAPVLGQVLGAGTLVQGLFTILGESDIQLDAALVRTTTSETTIAGDPVVGSLPEVLRLEKQLVYQILEELGVRPTDPERNEIDRLIVNDYTNFLDYCLGLQLEDEERYEEASRLFQDVAVKEPGFAATMNITDRVSKPRREFSKLVSEEFEEIARPDSGGPGGTGGILDDLAVSVGNGPSPGGDSGSGQGEDDATDLTTTDIEKVDQELRTIADFPPPPGGKP